MQFLWFWQLFFLEDIFLQLVHVALVALHSLPGVRRAHHGHVVIDGLNGVLFKKIAIPLKDLVQLGLHLAGDLVVGET